MWEELYDELRVQQTDCDTTLLDCLFYAISQENCCPYRLLAAAGEKYAEAKAVIVMASQRWMRLLQGSITDELSTYFIRVELLADGAPP